MKRTKRTKWALSVLLTLGTAALGLAPISSASAGPSDQPLSPGLLPAMQRYLGLTAAQAKARLQHEAAATTLAPRIGAREWIDSICCRSPSLWMAGDRASAPRDVQQPREGQVPKS